MDIQAVETLYPLTSEVRRLFHRLGYVVSELHRDTGVSAGMRGVLENLVADGPQSVPQLARRRPVSRQHIQILVNDLLAGGLVEVRNNPDHMRSHLIAATTPGRQCLAAMKTREAMAFRHLDLAMDAASIETATAILARLAEALENADFDATMQRMADTTGPE